MVRGESLAVPDGLGTPELRSVVGLTEGQDQKRQKVRKYSLKSSV